jgi:hypothetical protein
MVVIYVRIMNCESESFLQHQKHSRVTGTSVLHVNIPECKAVGTVFVIFLPTVQTLA